MEKDKIFDLIEAEAARQTDGLEMIPSENHSSPAVRQALGSVLTDKYSEGYPGKRYYGGNEIADQVETLAITRAKELFGVEHVNVQPYSGSPANQAVYFGVCEPGDTVMGQYLFDGGHLTHGWQLNFSGKFYKTVPYHVKSDGYIDLEEVRRLAIEHKPKLIWCGATAYPRTIPFAEFAAIADEVGAYLVADIAHIAGLIAGGVHQSPAPYVHIITTTTHKTLRGPRGGMIMITKKGMEKDPELANKIDKAIIPGLQGGPHNHQTAAIAVALAQAAKPTFKKYAEQIIKNSQALAQTLKDNDIKLISDGTDNHLLLIDLTPFGKGKGHFGQTVLGAVGITVNKNTIPTEPVSAFYPSGVRLGTPAITTRGMKEDEMREIGKIIATALKKISSFELPTEKESTEERKEAIAKFSEAVKNDAQLQSLREEVKQLCNKFPIADSVWE